MATQTIKIHSVKKTVSIKKRDKSKFSTSKRGKNKRCPTCGKFMKP